MLMMGIHSRSDMQVLHVEYKKVKLENLIPQLYSLELQIGSAILSISS